MEDLILILVLSGIGLVTLLVSVWLFYRRKEKRRREESLHGGMPGGHCGRSKLSCQSKYRLAKAAGAVSVAHLLSGAGGSVGKMASLGVKTATLGLYYYPVYRYTYRGETYEQIGDVPAMEEQARKRWERSLRFLSIRPNLPAFTAWRRKRVTFSSALPT